ncbi:hypothetical protein MRX96_058867 [Rhipicephalus microplus]
MQETLVRSKGYPLETHEVATQDGYLLQMHRILHGRDGHCGANETGMACCERGPVFVMTGLLADSASLVLDFPKQSLGYVLADNGYDVWLGNVRGTTYGKKHKELEVKSKKFWNFSFHEHAIFDVPANIDYILRETKRKDLLYIGMSQGTLTFFTMLAEKPWYNDKAYAAGSYEVLPQGMPIAGFVRHFCGHATRGICSYLADNFANFGSRYINEKAPELRAHAPRVESGGKHLGKPRGSHMGLVELLEPAGRTCEDPSTLPGPSRSTPQVTSIIYGSLSAAGMAYFARYGDLTFRISFLDGRND